jgi:serine/threonine-protein kinase
MATGANDWTGLTISDGRYLVKSKLGEGGMGVVYRAGDLRLGVDVVIKVPHRAMLDKPGFAIRFAREVRSLVRLSHPSIVKVTDVGQYDGLPFAIMQYLSGGSLDDRRRTAGGRDVPVDPRSVTAWLPGIASALDYIHLEGFVHRDVKPGNILFDNQGHAFLGDFGLIKALAADDFARAKTVTGAGLVLGTPDYMAPELIMARRVDGSADQYSLAVTLYEILCGRRPFQARTPTAVLVLHTSESPQPLTDHVPGLPAQLSAAILKGLSKNPADRFPTCAALADAVAAALAANPSFTVPIPPPTPARPDSVKIRCPHCNKKVAMSATMYNRLKQADKSVPCPACGASIEVASPRTQVLTATPPDVDVTPFRTQKLPSPLAGNTTVLPAADGPAPVTQKIEAPEPEQAPDADPGACYRVQTQLLSALEIESQHQPPLDALPAPAKPSTLAWIGPALAAVALSTGVLVFVLLPRGSAPISNASTSTTTQGNEDLPLELPTGRVDSQVADSDASSLGNSSTTMPSVPLARSVPLETLGPVPASPTSPPSTTTSMFKSPTMNPGAIDTGIPPLATAAAPLGAGARPPDGPPIKVNLDLDQIVAKRDQFAAQVVIPGGLYRVAATGAPVENGLATINVVQAELALQSNGMVRVDSKGASSELLVNASLLPLLTVSTRGGPPGGAGASAWSDNLALLTIRIGSTAPWTREVIKAEFLTSIDFTSIGHDQFKNSFQTLSISASEARVGVTDGDDWKSRVGTHFAGTVKAACRAPKNQATFAKWRAFNQEMGAMISKLQGAPASPFGR